MAGKPADVAAFSEFVCARSGALFRFGYLVMGDYQLAQDLVQESLAKTYQSWSRLRDAGKAEAYTRRVMVTTAISWRRRRSFGERPTDDLPELGVADAALLVGDQDELWSELHRLPRRQRTAVVLRYCEDLSERQTAELMGCSVGSVKRHCSMALGKLRAAMGPTFTLPADHEEAVTP